MNNLQELIELENRLQPHVREPYYTVIAPANDDDFEQFLLLANNTFEEVGLHNVLSNREGTRRIMENLYRNVDIRIFVIHRNNEAMLLHSTIEEYCRRNKIDFQ